MTRYAQNGGLTRFDEGKSHQENPLGGIPIGGNNSVEENETKQNNFIYSDRIYLDENIVSQYNLPKSLVGKSVADATKFIDNKFKGRNDKISQSTKNGMLSKIAEAQEAMKPQEPEIEQSQEGMIDPTQMAFGGYVNRQMEDGGYYDQNNPYFMQNPGVQQPGIGPMNQIQPVSQLTQANSLSQIKPFSTGNQLPTASAVPDTAGAIGGGLKEMSGKTGLGLSSALGAASTAIDLGKTAFGKPAQDTSGLAPSAKVNSGGMIAGSAMKGASAGMAFGPLGAGIGAAVGGVSGLLGSNKAKKAAIKNANNFAMRTNAQFSDQYALGGEILNPIDPIKVLATKQGISSSPINENPLFNTKRIVKYQPGATNDKLGRGFYLYSKDNTQPGFDPNRDREFIKQSEMLAVQRTPEWKEYMRNQSIQPKQFAMGGNIKKYEDGGYYDKNNPYFMTNPGPVNMGPNPAPTESILQQSGLKTIGTTVPYTIATQPKVDISNANRQFAPGPSDLDMLKYNAGKIGNYINQNAGNIARYAPIATNALQLSQLKKPQGERLDRLSNRYKPEYVDEAALQNIADQNMNNTVSAISQSGASQGQTRASILGSQLQRTKALSDAYNNAAAQNRATNDRAQTFNLGVDQVNLQQSNTEKENFARDQAAYRNAKREYITGIGEGIGDIGKEQVQKKIIAKTTGYRWDGTYVKDTTGNIVTDPATGKPMTEEKLKEIQSIQDKKALGGYLIKNKRQ